MGDRHGGCGLEARLIPVGAIVGTAVAAARQGRGQGPRKDLAPIVLLRLSVIFLALLVATMLLLRPRDPWSAAQVAPMMLAPLAVAFPTLLLTRIIIPLGLPRVAYAVARALPPVQSSDEMRGTAVLFGILAGLRARTLADETLARLEARLSEEINWQGASLAAAGLLAAARGKPDSARLLLAGVDDLNGRASSRVALRAARTWLVADASRRGDWRKVASLGLRRRRYLRWPWVMGAIAARFEGDANAPSALRILLAWFVAPHRRATWPLVQRALQPQGVAIGHRPPTAPDHQPIDTALDAHAAYLRTPSRTRLLAAAHAWDRARQAPVTYTLVTRRVLALETTASCEAILQQVFETAGQDLAAQIRCVPTELLDSSPVLQAAAQTARHRELDELDIAVKELARRKMDNVRLHIVEEWMAWLTLRNLCERHVRDATESARRAAFVAVYSPACDYAVWLFNDRGEKLLANRVFRWLSNLGGGVADAEAMALLTKNVACGDGLT